jgi:hypothetical protein
MPASLAKHLADPPLGIVIEQQHVSLTRHSFAELIAQSSHLARSWPVMAWLIVCHIDAARGRSLLGSPYTLVETLRRIMWEWPVGNIGRQRNRKSPLAGNVI